MLDFFQGFFAPPRDLILILAALWLGLIFAEKRAARYNVIPSRISHLVLMTSLAYLIGGRVFNILEHFSAFIQNPLSLISLNIDLFDNLGAYSMAVFTGLIYCRFKKYSLWNTLDSLTLFFSCFSIGIGFSHLATGAAFGRETNLPWAIYLWGTMRQPTQIYEIVLSILILGLVWVRKPNLNPGSDFLFFVSLISISRLVIETFRGDSTIVLGGLRLAQVLAWLLLALSLLGQEIIGQTGASFISNGNDIGSDNDPSESDDWKYARHAIPTKRTRVINSRKTKTKKRS